MKLTSCHEIDDEPDDHELLNVTQILKHLTIALPFTVTLTCLNKDQNLSAFFALGHAMCKIACIACRPALNVVDTADHQPLQN